MTKLSEADEHELAALDAKINALLPPRYVGCFEEVSPKSMGSASLKYLPDGRVAWGEIWTTFCHLALAGGPPHRGRLLPAVSAKESLDHPAEQEAVVSEIRRGIRLSADLPTMDETLPGWVAIGCHDEDMAAWLVRAIVAENVSARHAGDILYVPAGPTFRLEKEMKNVIVSVAKTCHYLLDHVGKDARPRGFEPNLTQPPLPDEIAANPTKYQSALGDLQTRLRAATNLETVPAESPGWLGIQCDSEEMATWMLRAVAVANTLARREEAVLFVPVVISDESDETEDKLAKIVGDALRCGRMREGE